MGGLVMGVHSQEEGYEEGCSLGYLSPGPRKQLNPIGPALSRDWGRYLQMSPPILMIQPGLDAFSDRFCLLTVAVGTDADVW